MVALITTADSDVRPPSRLRWRLDSRPESLSLVHCRVSSITIATTTSLLRVARAVAGSSGCPCCCSARRGCGVGTASARASVRRSRGDSRSSAGRARRIATPRCSPSSSRDDRRILVGHVSRPTRSCNRPRAFVELEGCAKVERVVVRHVELAYARIVHAADIAPPASKVSACHG